MYYSTIKQELDIKTDSENKYSSRFGISTLEKITRQEMEQIAQPLIDEGWNVQISA